MEGGGFEIRCCVDKSFMNIADTICIHFGAVFLFQMAIYSFLSDPSPIIVYLCQELSHHYRLGPIESGY